jgi:hypothetical protein
MNAKTLVEIWDMKCFSCDHRKMKYVTGLCEDCNRLVEIEKTVRDKVVHEGLPRKNPIGFKSL